MRQFLVALLGGLIVAATCLAILVVARSNNRADPPDDPPDDPLDDPLDDPPPPADDPPPVVRPPCDPTVRAGLCVNWPSATECQAYAAATGKTWGGVVIDPAWPAGCTQASGSQTVRYNLEYDSMALPLRADAAADAICCAAGTGHGADAREAEVREAIARALQDKGHAPADVATYQDRAVDYFQLGVPISGVLEGAHQDLLRAAATASLEQRMQQMETGASFRECDLCATGFATTETRINASSTHTCASLQTWMWDDPAGRCVGTRNLPDGLSLDEVRSACCESCAEVCTAHSDCCANQRCDGAGHCVGTYASPWRIADEFQHLHNQDFLLSEFIKEYDIKILDPIEFYEDSVTNTIDPLDVLQTEYIRAYRKNHRLQNTQGTESNPAARLRQAHLAHFRERADFTASFSEWEFDQTGYLEWMYEDYFGPPDDSVAQPHELRYAFGDNLAAAVGDGVAADLADPYSNGLTFAEYYEARTRSAPRVESCTPGTECTVTADCPVSLECCGGRCMLPSQCCAWNANCNGAPCKAENYACSCDDECCDGTYCDSTSGLSQCVRQVEPTADVDRYTMSGGDDEYDVFCNRVKAGEDHCYNVHSYHFQKDGNTRGGACQYCSTHCDWCSAPWSNGQFSCHYKGSPECG